MEKRRNCSKGAISPLFHNIFNISLTSRVQLHIYLLNGVNRISFSPNSANLICRSTDISKYFRESLGIQDNESRLYIKSTTFYLNSLNGCSSICQIVAVSNNLSLLAKSMLLRILYTSIMSASLHLYSNVSNPKHFKLSE